MVARKLAAGVAAKKEKKSKRKYKGAKEAELTIVSNCMSKECVKRWFSKTCGREFRIRSVDI